jgi:hypothetical protein
MFGPGSVVASFFVAALIQTVSARRGTCADGLRIMSP